jgi:hypothetical protein
MSKCLNCGKDIEQVGNRAKVYCSDKCRIAYGRKVQSEQNSNPNTVQSEHFNPNIQSEQANPNMPANFGLPDCQCKLCVADRAIGLKRILHHGIRKRDTEMTPNERNRVSLPGDVDYTKKPEDLLEPEHMHAWRIA